MVAGVDEHLRLRAEATAEHRCRSPVGEVGAVEARLEELVLDEQPHVGGQQAVELLQSCGEPRVPLAQIVLSWIVRAVGKPETDDRGADLLRDLQALAAVLERLLAHTFVRMAQAPEPVRVVPEEVRVDRPDSDAAIGCVPAQGRPVVDAVPRDVECDRRAATRQALDEGGVVDSLPDGAGGAGPGEDVEAGARVSVAPGRGLELERGEPGKRGGVGHAASVTHRPPHLQIDFRSTLFRKSFEGIDLWFGPG